MVMEGPTVPSRCHADAAANPAASTSPTGVAIWNPAFGPSNRTAGVASAWSARNPALERSASETRNSRASPRWPAASLVSTPSTTFTTATTNTSQKCDGWCSQRTSSAGTANNKARPASGSSSSPPRATMRACARCTVAGLLVKAHVTASLILEVTVRFEAMGPDALDFWLGTWDATWEGGNGTNTISRELHDAVVIERFEAGPPEPWSGMSVSVHDPLDAIVATDLGRLERQLLALRRFAHG